ncbi:Rrf2 family transcriptional regulator [Candidatus Peregrinibacteria bacterium]|nr:Rrf2 family transcriptional regulator [Candidatus Peregrinibacteria bacterium]
MNKNCGKYHSGALHLTQKVDYGLTLLIALASNKTGATSSIRAVTKEENLSFSFLQKIARELEKSGIIVAERGKFGGYRLTKKPEKLLLKEIIEALEGPVAIVPCLKKTSETLCRRKTHCKIKKKLDGLNMEIQNLLLSKSLKTFM